MNSESMSTTTTYENLLITAGLPLSALGAERLARILRNNFGTRTITTPQFKTAIRRYQAGIATADEQFFEDAAIPPPRSDYRQLSPKERRALRYRIAEGQSAAEIAREVCVSEDAIAHITKKTREAIKRITR